MSNFGSTMLAACACLAIAGCSSSGSTHPSGPADLPTASMGRIGNVAGDAAAESGDLARAADLYARAYQAQPTAATAAKASSAARRSGNVQAGLALARDAAVKFPHDSELLTEIGRDEAAVGATAAASGSYEDAAARPGAGWDTFVAKGVAEARDGNYAAARADFARARSMSSVGPQVNAADADLALVKTEMGDLAGGTSDLEKVARRPGASLAIQADLAMLYGFSGDRVRLRQQSKIAFPDPARAESVTRWLERAE